MFVIRYVLLILGTLIGLASEARHIAGGEMSYEYLGPGSGTTLRYRITLKLYRDCYTGGATLDASAAITVYQNGNSTPYLNLSVALDNKVNSELSTTDPCIENPPRVCYEIGYYIEEVELLPSSGGYTVAYQRCCRIDNITNVTNSGGAGVTYAAVIPGTGVHPLGPKNSSAIFNARDTVVICENNSFTYDFSANDPDNDDLSYEFDIAYTGGSQQAPQPSQAASPPYLSISYAFPFSALSPLGNRVQLNPTTGIISGIGPAAGTYVITVVVIERKQGVEINRHRKDLHIKVAPCTIAKATLDPEYVNCQNFTVSVRNKSNSSLIKSYYWDFGLPGDADTSNLDVAQFVYPDTGTYRVKLVTNRNQGCSDSTIMLVKVYPGFTPQFTVDEGCKNVPLQFKDQTIARYGNVNYWKWSFGNPQFNPDTSRQQNPSYSYPAIGTYNVQLIVGSTNNCRDTIEKVVTVRDKPIIALTNDTLICSIDTLKLKATGNGTFSWSPNYMINQTNQAEPLVSPDRPTTYYVRLTSAPGCENIDSVFVDVRTSIVVDAGPDTTICLNDSIQFRPQTEGLQFSWEATPDFRNPNVKNAVAFPKRTTTYTVNVNLGKCGTSDQIVVTTIPYPTVTSIADTTICYGDDLALSASGAETYRWQPSGLVSNASRRDPIASPRSDTTFVVAGFETKGCPKPGYDTIKVRVVPKIPAFAGNDTSIVIGQPLQLSASGGATYVWTPATGLSNPLIANPIAQLGSSASYLLKVSTIEGCFAYDTIQIKVFQTGPDIFVPTAFTPNHDKKNDKLMPIPVGVAKLDFFRVYNRFGQLVFATKSIGDGWDGRMNGREQGNSTVTWYVQGVDYTGQTIFKKGTTILIR